MAIRVAWATMVMKKLVWLDVEVTSPSFICDGAPQARIRNEMTCLIVTVPDLWIESPVISWCTIGSMSLKRGKLECLAYFWSWVISCTPAQAL
ncbi:hypothetical protein ACU8KH_02486 [Lachancea thermotolerans]